jgi:pilus assembly protein Flp/PilA
LRKFDATAFTGGKELFRTYVCDRTKEPVHPAQREPSMKNLVRFLNDESGATAIEYGLIAACISVAIIAVVQGVGTKLTNTFTSVESALK